MQEIVEKTELTTNEVATELGVKPVTVRSWCEKGLFKNARKETTPRGDYWLIPKTDLKTFKKPTRGKPLVENPSKATLAKRRQREQDKDLYKSLK